MAISKVTAGGIADIAAALEAASDSNKFTDADHSKLNAIEASATADQTAAQIKTALENGIDSVHYVDGSIDTAHIGDDQVTADKLANSINSAITANTAKVTNATHTGDVTGATALTIAAGAVDIAMLSATGTAGSGNFLRGDNSWATAGSTSASDLTSGTLPIARIADDAVTAAKLANSINTDIATGPAALPKAGGTMSGNISMATNEIDWGDDGRARFGASQDLQIYHDSNRSWIQDVGTSSLIIDTDGPEVDINSGGNAKFMGRFIKDAEVSLYHDGVKKFETEGSGVLIQGEVDGNGGGFRIKSGSATLGGIFKSGTIEGNSNADVTVFAETGKKIHLCANGSATKVLSVSANGLLFNGDTAAANALDDYEEGTFTPTLTASSGGSAGTYNNQYGHYTKIGNTVRVTIHCGALKGSLNGQIEVSGLPFTADGNHRGIKMELYVPSGTASVDATGFLYDNTSKIPHWIATAATTDSTGRAFTSSDLGSNGCRIYYFFTYQT